jgi:hypothetical protein
VTFQDALAFGRDGEERVAAKLIRLGFVVSPLYQYEGHKRAPVLLYRLDGAVGCLTHPDLAVFGKTCCFAEVKRKRRWVDFDRGRGLETGCNLGLWQQYLAVGRATGLPVWLFFIHEEQEPTGVFAGQAERLLPHLREWDGLRGTFRVSKPLALFPRTALLPKWTLAELDDCHEGNRVALQESMSQPPASPRLSPGEGQRSDHAGDRP